MIKRILGAAVLVATTVLGAGSAFGPLQLGAATLGRSQVLGQARATGPGGLRPGRVRLGADSHIG